MNKTDNWTYDEFHAFVMLYAANADGKIEIEEENLIVPTLAPEAYSRIKHAFEQCDDAKALDIILSYRDQYCATQTDKERILADMLDIYKVNNGFQQIEQGVHLLFLRLL